MQGRGIASGCSYSEELGVVVHKYIGSARTCLCGQAEVELPVRKYHVFYRRAKSQATPTFEEYDAGKDPGAGTGEAGSGGGA